jgi:hypothetical protein
MRGLLLLLITLITLVTLAACGGAHSSVPRPAWASGANIEHPDFVLVVGTCQGRASDDDARQCALADANQQLQNTLGVRGGLVREQHQETRWGSINRGNQTVLTIVHDAWVLVAYPRKRIKVDQ